MNVTKISSAQAKVGDPKAMTRLLDEVPEAEEIQEQLGRPFFARRWQQSLQRSFWITSDGSTAECLTLTGLDVEEVLALWIAFDTHRSRAGFRLSASSLGEIIETELGVTVEFDAWSS